MPDIVEDLQPNLLENMIRQRKLMGSMGDPGLPSPMPENAPTAQPQTNGPDMTVHVHHALGLPETPTPKVGPIDPNSEAPAESAYKQALMNEPMHGDYHPSKLRKVLSTIAGMGVGAFQGPDVGAQVMSNLRDMPYNSQHEDWKQFAGNREALATEEAAQTAAGQKALTDQSLINEREASANHSNAETRIIAPDMKTDVQNRMDVRQAALKTDTRELKLNDGTIKHAVQRNGKFYDAETNALISRDAIEDISDEGKSLKDTKTARIPGNLGQSVQARKIVAEGVGGENKYDQPTVDAAKEYVKKLDAGAEPAGAFARIIKDRNAEREAAGKPKMTSMEEEALQTKLLSIQKPPQTLMVGPDNEVFTAKPGTKLPEGSSTPTQMGAGVAKNAQEQKDLKADQEFVNDYLNNQTHTGPGDEALLERFFNVTKPSTGFRMNQAQIALLTKLRSFSSNVKAFLAHQTGGTLFDDKQRKEIVDQINNITSSKLGTKSPTLPGGISIQDIDAEIARRKGGK